MVYTDVVQALIMITTLIVGPIVGFIYIANTPNLFAHSITDALTKAGSTYTSLTGAATGFGVGVVIMSGFSWFFGYLGGQPQLSTRFMAIKDPRHAKQGRNIGIAWTMIAYIGALCLGWIGLAVFGPTGLADQEYVMPAVLLKIFPPAIAAVLIMGAIAAMISTADSLLILSASELSDNLINPYFAKKTTDDAKRKKDALNRARLVTAILAIIALGVAYISPSKLIFTMVSYVWAGIGGTFSVVILFTLFWKRYHGKAVIATILSGVTFTILWNLTGMEKKITARIMTFLVTAILAVIYTYVWHKKKERI